MQFRVKGLIQYFNGKGRGFKIPCPVYSEVNKPVMNLVLEEVPPVGYCFCARLEVVHGK